MSEINWGKEFEEAKDTFEYKLERLALDITEDILEMMEKKGLSRKELAKKLGVSKPAVSKLLNQGSNITIKRLLAISEALNSEVKITIKPKSSGQREVSRNLEYHYQKSQNVIQFSTFQNAEYSVDSNVNGENIHADAS